MGDLQDHILDAMRSEGRSLADVERAADAIGLPHGQKATASQRAAILARLYGWSIEQPEDGVPTAPVDGEEGARPSSPPTTDELLDAAVAVAEAPTPKAGRTIEEAIADAEKRAKTPKVPA